MEFNSSKIIGFNICVLILFSGYVIYVFQDELLKLPGETLKKHNELWYGKNEKPVLDHENPTMDGYKSMMDYQRSRTPEFFEGDKRCYMFPNPDTYGGLAFLTYIVATKDYPCEFITDEDPIDNGELYFGKCLNRIGKSSSNYAKPGECEIVD